MCWFQCLYIRRNCILYLRPTCILYLIPVSLCDLKAYSPRQWRDLLISCTDACLASSHSRRRSSSLTFHLSCISWCSVLLYDSNAPCRNSTSFVSRSETHTHAHTRFFACLLKAYCPANRTGSPQGFYKTCTLHTHKTYKHNSES